MISNSVFNVTDVYGIKLLTRLRLGLSYLREYKFRHNFQDTINPLCFCNLEIESIFHFSALPKFHHPFNQSYE